MRANWRFPAPGRRAFSLVEVALALGIVAFALLGILALVPLGVQSNRASAEETRGIAILTEVEADLRNSYPSSGKSRLFGLQVPYALTTSSAPRVILGSPLTNSLATGYTTGLNDHEQMTAVSSRPRYQASVIYTSVPVADGALAPIEARLVVNWPCLNTTAPADLITKSSGYVESYVTFPAP